PTPISYGHNQQIFGYGGGSSACFGDFPDWATRPIGMAGIPSPANTYLIADYAREYMETWWVNNLRAANYTRVYPDESAPRGGASIAQPAPWPPRLSNSAIYRHQLGQNITFADGHSKFRNGKQITSGDDFLDNMPTGKHAPEGLFVRDY